MNIHAIYTNEEIGALAKQRFQEERSLQRLDGWFLVKEIRRECDGKFGDLAPALKSAFVGDATVAQFKSVFEAAGLHVIHT